MLDDIIIGYLELLASSENCYSIQLAYAWLSIDSSKVDHVKQNFQVLRGFGKAWFNCNSDKQWMLLLEN